ncbi:MAG: hypothetical protein ACI9GZ_002541 [Bacteroidia bacterium]|jgi:hypothetical protein
MKKNKNLNRRKALSTMLKGGIGVSAALSAVWILSSSCESSVMAELSKTVGKPMLMKVGC